MIRDRAQSSGSPPLPDSRRSGSSLIEVGVAVVLLVSVMGVLVPVLARTTEMRHQIEKRELALGTVSNLLERAVLTPQPTAESLQPIADPLTDKERLPAPEWKIVVTPEQNPPMNRVEATLSWQSRRLVRHSVTLVRWFTGEQP